MILKWVVVESYFPEVSTQCWLYMGLSEGFENPLRPESHSEDWFGALSRQWDFKNVPRPLSCAGGLRTTALAGYFRISGKEGCSLKKQYFKVFRLRQS